MDEYFIGAGALLTAGESASVTGATLHARTEDGLAGRVRAAVIDFESTRFGELSQILLVAAGWSAARFRGEVVSRLLSRRDCTLVDVISILSQATGAEEVHVFARWRPDGGMAAMLENDGVRVVAHPLEALGQAALVCGQRIGRWAAGRAA